MMYSLIKEPYSEQIMLASETNLSQLVTNVKDKFGDNFRVFCMNGGIMP